MPYYLKKNRKKIILPCFLLILSNGIFALWQLSLMRTFDAAARLNLKEFLTWIVIDIIGIALNCVVHIGESTAEAKVIRDLNNQLRHDLYLSLMDKSHASYHNQDTGEYLSWLTSNIKQIERLAWNPLFRCVGCIAGVVCNIAALISLHWIILLTGLISVATMLALPKMFNRQMDFT